MSRGVGDAGEGLKEEEKGECASVCSSSLCSVHDGDPPRFVNRCCWCGGRWVAAWRERWTSVESSGMSGGGEAGT